MGILRVVFGYACWWDRDSLVGVWWLVRCLSMRESGGERVEIFHTARWFVG